MPSAQIAEVAHKHRKNPRQIEDTLNDVFGRIEQYNAKLNAIVHVFKDASRERAKLLIKHSDQYKNKPLYGVPITIKESFAYKSSPTTINFPPLKNNKPEASSPTAKPLAHSTQQRITHTTLRERPAAVPAALPLLLQSSALQKLEAISAGPFATLQAFAVFTA